MKLKDWVEQFPDAEITVIEASVDLFDFIEVEFSDGCSQYRPAVTTLYKVAVTVPKSAAK